MSDVRQKDIPTNFDDAIKQLIESHHLIESLESQLTLSQAREAAAFRAAANVALDCENWYEGRGDAITHDVHDEILARIPADSTAALERLLADSVSEIQLKFTDYCSWIVEQSKWLASDWRKKGDLSDVRVEARAYFRCAEAIERMFVLTDANRAAASTSAAPAKEREK